MSVWDSRSFAVEYNKSLIREIVGWDVATWSKAVYLWDEVIPEDAGNSPALELGAGRGGLSLYLALHGYRVICSDVDSPESVARQTHERYAVTNRVFYQSADATSIPYADASFDVVAFKSVLGGVGKISRSAISTAISEIHRVLKPGGLLLFAENLSGSNLHMALRRRFVKWGHSWYYPSLGELQGLLAPFSDCLLETTGFCANLGRSEWQRSCLHQCDRLIVPLLSEKQRYLAFGWARKGSSEPL